MKAIGTGQAAILFRWLSITSLLALTGCMDSTVLEYETLEVDLDGKNELQVSTYPSYFPDVTYHIPFIYKQMRTPERVYFQFFVRALGQNGPNPHIEDIVVHSFSYHFPGQEPVVLLEDYEDNFWMQGDPRYGNAEVPPVLHSKGWYLQVEVDMTVNGERYQISEQMDANERQYSRPLLFDALR